MAKNNVVRAGTFTARNGMEDTWELVVSPRARNVRVKMSPEKGIVVVVPAGYRRNPQLILEEHRDWIEQTMVRIAPQREAYRLQASLPLPEVLEFPGIGERWPVVYESTDTVGVTARTSAGTLAVKGAVSDRELCGKALSAFAFKRAKEALPELLAATDSELGVGYAACRVRNAKSRWGSCAGDGTIMLSSYVIFLPPPLVYHVMCHELAHRVHMDHSAAFHELLAEFDPDAKRHAAELKRAGIYVPAWMRS